MLNRTSPPPTSSRRLSSYIHDDVDGPKYDAEILWFDRDRPGGGFGFLRVMGYPNDLFIHVSQFNQAGLALPPTDNRATGIKLRCRVGIDRKGKPWAVDLEYR